MRIPWKTLVAGALVSLASAQAEAAPCGTNITYSTWVNTPNFSCTVGDKQFSNFSFSSGTGLTADQFKVSPDTIAPPGEIGLLFSTGVLSVVGNGRADATIDFDVTTLGDLINDARLVIAGVITGTGSATVGETLSNGVTLTASLPQPVVDLKTFSPVSSLGVLKDALVIGFTGTTSISAIENDFSEVPEPGTLALLGTALTGLGWLGRRRKRT